MPRSKLLLAVELYRAMSSKKVVGADLRGRIVITASTTSLLEEIFDRGMTLDCVYMGVPVGQEVDVELAIPRGQSEFFAETWQDFLDSHNFKFAAPKEYYIAKDDFLNSEETETLSSRRYASILALVSVLREAADYIDSGLANLKFVYLVKTKFELPVEYNFVSFRDTPGVVEMAAEFASASTAHKEQRKVILKVVLSEMLGNVEPKIRFKELLERFTEFARRVKEGYDLYVAEFSFEKVLEEVETHKLDYTIKLNKVFSDIQSQLLAIPVALILVGSQMADKGYPDWKNIIIICGVVIYVTLMDLLIRNQYHSLAAIKTEMDLKHAHLLKRHMALKDNFVGAYKALDARYDQQRWLIRIVDGLVALMFVTSVVLFYWYSTSRFHWLKVWIGT